MHQRYPRDDACNRNGRICCPLALSTSSCSSSSDWPHVDQPSDWTRKPNNTTVIRVNQSSNQNQNLLRPMVGQYHFNSRGEDDIDNEPLYDPVAPTRIDYEVHDFDANPRDEANRRLVYRLDNARQQDVIYDGPADDLPMYHASKENGQAVGNRLADLQLMQRQSEADRKTITTVEVHQSVCPPAPPPPLPYKWPAETKPMNAMGMQMGSTMSMGSTGSTETESSLESSCSKDSASTSSSLSTSSCEPASTVSYGSATAGSSGATSKTTDTTASAYATSRNCAARTSPIASTDLSTAITQELQRRAQQRMNNAAKADAPKEKMPDSRKPQNPETLKSQEQKITHDKLMEEFKRAHQKMFNSAQQKVQLSEQVPEKEQEKRVLNGASSITTTTMTTTTTTTTTGASAPPPPPLPFPTKTRGNDDSVEMQSIESFKLKETPNPVPKPPPTYFPVSSSAVQAPSVGSPRHVAAGNKSQLINGKNAAASLAPDHHGKASSSPVSPTNGAQSAKPAIGGKVAIRIGAYEGETKQPAKLEFLSQQSRGEKAVNEETPNGPVVSRLQNELAATLQRSNLRRKTEGENQSPVKIIPENAVTSINDTTNSEVNKLPLGNVEKLASALNNKVTIKVNPEHGGR